MRITRRDLLIGSAGLAVGASVSVPFLLPKYHFDRRRRRSRVAILNVDQYSQKIENILQAALRLFPIDVVGKSVVLKPNLVGYLPSDAINTHRLLIVAAAECLRLRGAKSVLVADGPGHHRDTQLVLSQSGYEDSLRGEKIRFVELNRDELVRTPLRASYTGMKHLWLPRTVLEADFVVSMPKIKAHHWSEVTLSMKNMFGVVPGTRSGWPKTFSIGQAFNKASSTSVQRFQSTLSLLIALRRCNGPLNGTWRRLGNSCFQMILLLPTSLVHV
jgi:uncharacterized protein (DUF362 family)